MAVMAMGLLTLPGCSDNRTNEEKWQLANHKIFPVEDLEHVAFSCSNPYTGRSVTFTDRSNNEITDYGYIKQYRDILDIRDGDKCGSITVNGDRAVQVLEEGVAKAGQAFCDGEDLPPQLRPQLTPCGSGDLPPP
jgi:hypothetical protein